MNYKSTSSSYKKLFGILLFVFFITNVFFQIIIYGKNNYNNIFLNSFFKIFWINSPIFWFSSFGLIFKLLIQTSVITISFYIYFKIINLKIKAKDLFPIIGLSHFIFYIQMFLEFVYFKINNSSKFFISKFSLFSIDYFSQIYNRNYPNYLNYLFTTINIFELFFIIFFIYILKKITNSNYIFSFFAVMYSYILPLIIWLALMTYISLPE